MAANTMDMGGAPYPNAVNNGQWYGDVPQRPNYAVAYDPAKMSLSDYLQGHYDHSAFDQYKAEAMRKGPSAWAQMAKHDQEAQASDHREKGAAETNAQTAKSMDMLASHGGLSSGARERAGMEGAKNYLSMSQGIGRQQNLNELQIGMNDEQNRIQQLSQVPGMEMDQSKMWTTARDNDINNKLSENERRNKYNMDVYGQQMSAWAADRQARATENSGGGGSSFICTALRAHKLMTPKETLLMTRFMLRSLFAKADFFAWYFKHGARAIELAEQQNFNWALVKSRFVDDLLAFDMGKPEELAKAQALYITRAGEFCTQFLGVEAGFQASFAEPGKLKALIALPKIFLRPGTYRWAYGYFRPRVLKRLKRALRVVA